MVCLRGLDFALGSFCDVVFGPGSFLLFLLGSGDLFVVGDGGLACVECRA